MGIWSKASLQRRWRGAAGGAVVTLLAVIGSYVEANPAHSYGGLHLTRHPPLYAYLLVGVPALALVWRNSRPVGVFLLAVAGAVGWASVGQIGGAGPVPGLVGLDWGARPARAAAMWRRAASGWPGSVTARSVPSRSGKRRPAAASTPSGCVSRANS